MNDDELKEICKTIIKDLQGGILSQKAIIKRNFNTLVELRKLNISINKIIEVCGFTYTNASFRNKFYECKRSINTNDPDIQKDKCSTSTKNLESKHSIRNNTTTVLNNTTRDYSDWIEAFDFKDTFHENALKIVVPSLEKGGWDCSNYHLLRSKYEIMTLDQLIKIIGTMKSSKYRKIVYKDGQACF